MKLVLIGCPGAGKGTQAKMLSKKFGIAHISTGDLLREQMKRGTELGKKVSEIMNTGGLVSDDIVSAMLAERIKEDDCKKGYILDGYPRNVAQAEGLDDITGPLDKVICYEVADDVIVDRMTGRRSCPECGKCITLHTTRPRLRASVMTAAPSLYREKMTMRKLLRTDSRSITKPLLP